MGVAKDQEAARSEKSNHAPAKTTHRCGRFVTSEGETREVRENVMWGWFDSAENVAGNDR